MTISSSLAAGVAGLNANATRLATISDNIANSATYGYKRSEADFHSLVIQGNQGGFSAGGVRTTTQRLIDERGPLITTSNPTESMISIARATNRNVTRWRDGQMVLRWTAALAGAKAIAVFFE